MNSLQIGSIELLQFERLAQQREVSHFCSTRHGGVSMGKYASLNLGFHSGDDLQAVKQNRKRLAKAAGFDRIWTPRQVHGSGIGLIDADFLSFSPEQQSDYLQSFDALVTNQPGVCVGVTTADCVPVLLLAPDVKAVAAVHAGWRGTVQQIAKKTIYALSEQFGADPQQMLAGIGPSISAAQFEVGDEVVDAFRASGADMSLLLCSGNSSKAHIDLWEANRQQLLAAGLMDVHIEVAGLCTYNLADCFYSARREGVQCGRMLSGIGYTCK